MILSNYYYYFQSALSPEVCNSIIELGKNKLIEQQKSGEGTTAVTFGQSQKGNDNRQPIADVDWHQLIQQYPDKTPDQIKDLFYNRDSEAAWLRDQWIYDLIWPYIHKANKESGWLFEFAGAETFQFTKYSPGGFYNWHNDGGSDHTQIFKKYIDGVTPDGPHYTRNNSQVGNVRKLSLTINLNAPGEYEGGDLKFDLGPHCEGERYQICQEIRPQGSIVLFPSFVAHQVTPVKTGTRYSLVLWVHGRPFK